MKKPKYTRSYYLQEPPCSFELYSQMKFAISRIQSSLAYAKKARRYALQKISIGKIVKRERRILKEWVVYKRNKNELIKRHTRQLVGGKKRLNAIADITKVVDTNYEFETLEFITTPFNVFHRMHPHTRPDALQAVKQLPDVIEHLEKAFADIEDGPFKGMLYWRAFVGPTEKTIAGSEGKLLYVKISTHGPINHRIVNKMRGYIDVWHRICDTYATYRFLLAE